MKHQVHADQNATAVPRSARPPTGGAGRPTATGDVRGTAGGRPRRGHRAATPTRQWTRDDEWAVWGVRGSFLDGPHPGPRAARPRASGVGRRHGGPLPRQGREARSSWRTPARGPACRRAGPRWNGVVGGRLAPRNRRLRLRFRPSPTGLLGSATTPLPASSAGASTAANSPPPPRGPRGPPPPYSHARPHGRLDMATPHAAQAAWSGSLTVLNPHTRVAAEPRALL